MRNLLFTSIIPLVLSASVHAVAPDPGPIEYSVISRNGSYKVNYKPNSGFSCVEEASGKVIWKTENCWYRGAIISDDGRKLVALSEDGKSLEDKASAEIFTVFTIFKDGKIVKKVKIGDLYPDSKSIEKMEKRSAGYYYWGDVVGFSDNENIEIIIMDKKSVLFNLNTGDISKMNYLENKENINQNK